MKRFLISAATVAGAFLAASVAGAAVPPPPANQFLGIPDTIFNNLTESACRTCHNQNPPTGVPVDSTYLPTRHHLLVAPSGKPPVIIPIGTDAPCADAGWSPACTPGTSSYQCLSCHKENYDPVTDTFTLDPNFRDCMICHQQTGTSLTVHHRTTIALQGMCAACHGDFVASLDKGQPAPTYIPSIVTPWPSKKLNGDNTVPANSAGAYAGNCNYCHNTKDGQPYGTPQNSATEPSPFGPVKVYRNDQTHHNTGYYYDNSKCQWCHNLVANAQGQLVYGPPNAYSIRTCERCHDIRSLHNIQYDDAKNGISPGNENPWYGHIGAQADCWGCHGNNGQTINGAAELGSSPTSATVPGAFSTSFLTSFAGAALPFNLSGNGFVNEATINGVLYNFAANVQLVDKAGVATEIVGTTTPTDVAVTLPATLAPGAYTVQAKKGTYKKSNPLVIALKPKTTVAAFSFNSTTGLTTVTGTNFGAYQNALTTPNVAASTKVLGLYNGATLTGKVSSWTDTQIAVKFMARGAKGKLVPVAPSKVTVVNVYGQTDSATSGGGGGGKRK